MTKLTPNDVDELMDGTDTPRGNMNEWLRKLIDSASEPMQAAIAAGIPLDFTSEKTHDGGLRITATTKYPCALVDVGGRKILYYRPEMTVK